MLLSLNAKRTFSATRDSCGKSIDQPPLVRLTSIQQRS